MHPFVKKMYQEVFTMQKKSIGYINYVFMISLYHGEGASSAPLVSLVRGQVK